MDYNYFLLFKTAQAEFRAWEQLPEKITQNILPIVELTRGRKKPKVVKDAHGKIIEKAKWPETLGVYDFQNVIDKVRETFKESPAFIFDLTREEGLSCAEIDELSASTNGYESWVNFLETEKANFRNFIPTLLINPSEGETEADYKDNITDQLDSLMRNFPAVAYRTSILIDPDFVYDLLLLRDSINRYVEAGKEFIIELDHEFIRPGTGMLHAMRTIGVIEKINELIPRAQIVVLATSFPKTIEELGNPEHDSFPTEEVFLFDEIKKNCKTGIPFFYGDYGSINPLRNDQAGSSGWRPRIDFPTSKKKTFYYREKREREDGEATSTYASHYISVAKKVLKDASFEDVPESWGVKQIKLAAGGAPPGKAPSFWISVRMEIHLRQQIKRLKLGH